MADATPPKVDVSVIIVTYNSGDVLTRCLDSLRAHTQGVSFEVIIVDNASHRDPPQRGDVDPRIRILHLSRNVGLSAAINAGVAASSGRYIMQLNPDTHIDHDALTVLVAYLRDHPDVGVAAPKLLNDDGTLQLSCRAFPGYATALFSRYSLLTRLWPGNPFSKRYLMTGFDHTRDANVDWVSAAALMYPREVHDNVGGWDAGFFLFSEDVDFCKRVHQAGLRVMYVPEASVFHTIGISERPSTRAIVERHRSMWRYYRKHARKSPVQDVFTAPAIAVRCAFALARRLISRA